MKQKSRINVELETDNEKVLSIYRAMNANGTLSKFLESLVILRINNYESKATDSVPVAQVKSGNKSDLTFENSVLNLLYDVKEIMEEFKEGMSVTPKAELDLNSIGDVMRNVLSSVPVTQHVSSPLSNSNLHTSASSLEAPKTVDLGYLDAELGEVVKTSILSDSGSSEEASGTVKKKSMKGMNMSKMKKLKGG